jgi:hypothetical protein
VLPAVCLCALACATACSQDDRAAPAGAAKEFAGTKWIDFAGYERCPVLYNKDARVVLGPHCGGRVLEYSWKGKNALHLDPKQHGLTVRPPKRNVQPSAGRFDIGPDVAPAHAVLWSGPWTAEVTGPRRARMTSRVDRGMGLRVVREFALAADSSRLQCTQTLVNVSNEVKRYCYWGRSFSPGGGTCIVPLTRPSRFPGGYAMLAPGSRVLCRAKDPRVKMSRRFAVVADLPRHPEIGFDSYAGWMAYHRDGMLFVKKFPAYRDRIYSNSMVTFTIVIYYTRTICELEPFGPEEKLQPGQSASFTVDWWFTPYAGRARDGSADPEEVERIVRGLGGRAGKILRH